MTILTILIIAALVLIFAIGCLSCSRDNIDETQTDIHDDNITD